MRIDRECQIEAVVSKDGSRKHLCNLWLDVDKKRLVATDGHCLAVVPVTDLDKSPGPCPHDETGYVDPRAIAKGRKDTPKKMADFAVSANGQHCFVDGSTMPRPKVEQVGQFPPYEQVIPSYRKGDAGTVTIGLDANLLLHLARAIGIENGYGVTLTFPIPTENTSRAVMLDPFVIEGKDGALGVLMPCRT